ncbi:methyltransferase [Blautia sp. An249]|uniref:class I SAM-dependent methyltransferase n=1 Tax=Blautia sp. An249 TaxID=1965603 RepID=UPI000B397ADC|nr:class I SAM-dependent methyltransferase [Blautia sp. An249]OUO77532.1 methyltransferase [Blautia sp. An249]
MERYKIEKNTVQETLIIPLYGRKLCSEKFPELFQDKTAAALLEKIDYDFFALEKKSKSLMQVFGALEVAMRQSDLQWEVQDYLKSHPEAAVINLGCGLDNTGRVCDNGYCKIYNVDLPDVIELRNRLLPAGEREKNLALDLTDFHWMEAIDADPAKGTVLFAAGVFYYFQTEALRKLFPAMAVRFPGGRLVFDGASPAAVKLMLKTWIKQAGIQDVGAYFSVRDAKAELGPWSDRFRVTARGYMLGYQKLDDPAVKPIHRLLARIADNRMKLQIVRLDFVRS